MRCELQILEKFNYYIEKGFEPYPVLPIKIFRRELVKVVDTAALVDTGFDGALIASRALGDYIYSKVERMDGAEEIDAAGIGIPCDFCIVDLQVGGKWFRVKMHVPRAGDLGTILGRVVLNRLNICLRGLKSELCLA